MASVSDGAPTAWCIADLQGSGPFDLALGPYGDGHLFAGAGLGLDLGGFVADPFYFGPFGSDAMPTQLLFEYWDPVVGRGRIGLAEQTGDATWGDARCVIDEPFHLSYPHPVRAPGFDGLVIVESAQAGEVRAYRAQASGLWAVEATLIEEPLLDPTPFVVNGTWYLFGASPGGADDTLDLWVSGGDVFGPWRRHPAAPVCREVTSARPAGPVTAWDGQLHRLAQKCDRRYGEAVLAIPIEHITPEEYREGQPTLILGGGDLWWNRLGMHHLDVWSSEADPTIWRGVADGQRPWLTV